MDTHKCIVISIIKKPPEIDAEGVHDVTRDLHTIIHYCWIVGQRDGIEREKNKKAMLVC